MGMVTYMHSLLIKHEKKIGVDRGRERKKLRGQVGKGD
jgi:hypothetical protein